MDVLDRQTREWIKVGAPYLYEVFYQNGGLAMSLTYKFLWLFFTAPPAVDKLDGAEYGGPVAGGGLGITVNPGIGIDVQVMNGINRPG